MNEEDRLRAELREFLPPLPDPTVDRAARERMLTAVLAAIPAPSRPQPLRSWAWWCHFLRLQARVVRQEIWWASLLVIALGTAVSVAVQQAGMAGLPLIVVAPMVTAVGVALLYSDSTDGGLWEMEQVTAIPPATLLLSRLFLLFGFDMTIAIAASGVVAWLLPTATWWGLVATWLAPMTFLAALALFIASFARSPEAAVIFSLLLWILHTIQLVTAPSGYNSLPLPPVPDLTAPATQPFLWLLAVGLTILAIRRAVERGA